MRWIVLFGTVSSRGEIGELHRSRRARRGRRARSASHARPSTPNGCGCRLSLPRPRDVSRATVLTGPKNRAGFRDLCRGCRPRSRTSALTSRGLRGIKPMFNGTTIHRQDDARDARQLNFRSRSTSKAGASQDSTVQGRSCMNRDNMRRLDEYRFAPRRTARERPDRRAGRRRHGPPGVHQAGDGARPLGRRDRLGARRLRHAARVRRPGRPPRRAAASASASSRPRLGALDPHTYQDQGGLTTGGIAGRVPHPGDADADARAGAGAQLEAERERLGVDVQAAPERQVPERAELRRRRRRRDLQPPLSTRTSGSQALSALQGRALARRHQEDRQPHGRVHISTRRPRTSPT